MSSKPTSSSKSGKAPVVDLFSRQTLQAGDEKRLVRICPEFDNTCMLYSNDSNPGKVFKLNLIAWGLQQNGNVVGLVPWLNSVSACPSLTDPLNGHWEGYFDAFRGQIFYDAPSHIATELHTAYEFHQKNGHYSKNYAGNPILQEIPDQIGTHAVFSDNQNNTFLVITVFSWQLHCDGRIDGMLVDPTKVEQTPVLAGDDALYAVNSHADFKYFFQYAIANKIKSRDPEALKAMSALIKF